MRNYQKGNNYYTTKSALVVSLEIKKLKNK